MNPKISPTHLEKLAIVYVRQSSQTQVKHNVESQELQYALKETARKYGWPDEKIIIIDADLGLSGASLKGRNGFKELQKKVGLFEVGIILSYEVTRFARNCVDWFQLLDLCWATKTLIGERDGVFDPSHINDRLLLGMKGQISELELSTLRGRLIAGAENKAKKGELFTRLPAGYEFDHRGKISMDPNEAVRERLFWLFDCFLMKRSLGGVVREMNRLNILLPRRNYEGSIDWRKPVPAGLSSTLKNVAYAGVYSWGKNRIMTNNVTDIAKKSNLVNGTAQVYLEDQWPAYLTLDRWKEIQKILDENHSNYKFKTTPGIVRKGEILLHGIVWCKECANKMTVSYNNGPTYVCRNRNEFTGKSCQSLRAERIDSYVGKEILTALNPIEVEIYNSAVRSLEHSQNSNDRTLTSQIERLRYETRLAERRYKSVDPENRLVAKGLELEWNNSLEELQTAEMKLSEIRNSRPNVRSLINKSLKDQIEALGINLQKYWQDNSSNIEVKKKISRVIIKKVFLKRLAKDMAEVELVWAGNAVSSIRVPLACNGLKNSSTFAEIKELVKSYYHSGSTDSEIASKLNSSGFKGVNGEKIKISTIKKIRGSLKLRQLTPQQKPRATDKGFTIREIGIKLKCCDRSMLRRDILAYGIKIHLDKKNRVSFIRDSQLLRDFLDTRTTEKRRSTST